VEGEVTRTPVSLIENEIESGERIKGGKRSPRGYKLASRAGTLSRERRRFSLLATWQHKKVWAKEGEKLSQKASRTKKIQRNDLGGPGDMGGEDRKEQAAFESKIVGVCAAGTSKKKKNKTHMRF